jgi:hypothetical protein
MDTVKAVTDICDGKSLAKDELGHISKPSHCSVMGACWQILEEVDRNYPFVV